MKLISQKWVKLISQTPKLISKITKLTSGAFLRKLACIWPTLDILQITKMHTLKLNHCTPHHSQWGMKLISTPHQRNSFPKCWNSFPKRWNSFPRLLKLISRRLKLISAGFWSSGLDWILHKKKACLNIRLDQMHCASLFVLAHNLAISFYFT